MNKLNLLAVLSLASLVACSAGSESSSPALDSDRQGGSFGSDSSVGVPPTGAAAPPSAPPSGDPTSAPHSPDSGAPPQAGVLTAGAWDDNENLVRFLGYRSRVAASGVRGLLPIDESEHRAANAAPPSGPKQTLDVSLMIDTTGSMGDELSYLQRELTALAGTIGARYPGAQQRWSLAVYRDVGDQYVVRTFDFRSNVAELRARLSEQSAGGGGDFPEAPDSGLDAVNQFAWRTGADTARLVFWVADAPHHEANAGAMAGAIRGARDKGLHIYPIASSGIDELTELTMRSAAQLTGGRYLFLTNDSGLGNAHKEPSVPCYFVTRLDRAILRMVDVEMSGHYQPPASDEILRTGGNPTDRACQLESGAAQAF